MKIVGKIFLPAVLLVYVGLETYAKLNHGSICGSTGCKLAGDLLIFPDIYLNYLGLAAALSLLLFGLLSKNDNFFDKLFFTVLYSAIAFETIIFSYQYFVNPEPCIFCMGVYGLLIGMALLANTSRVLFVIPLVLSLWFAMAILSTPRNSKMLTDNGRYLIYSKKCPHCKKVKKYFEEHNVSYSPIPISNPNALWLLRILGITKVPVLLENDRNHIEVTDGDAEIITNFTDREKKNISDENIDAKSLSYNKKESSGCEIGTLRDSTGSGCEESTTEIPYR